MRVWPKRLPDLHLRLPPGWYVLPAYMPRREVRRLLELLGDGLEGIEQPTVISIAHYSGSRTAEWIAARRLGKEDKPRTRLLRGYRVCPLERALAECCATLPARVVGRAIDDALRETGNDDPPTA